MWRACVALEDSLDTKVETWAENLCGRDKRALRHAQVGPPAPHFPSGSRAQRRARSLVYTFRDGKCREPQHELMEDKEFHELFRQATILLPCAPQFCALRPRVP